MEQMPTPPPIPRQHKTMSYGIKVLLMSIQCFILMIGALAVWIMSESREDSNRNVADSIISEWGSYVNIHAPFATKAGKSDIAISPSKFICDIQVDSKSLHRGIYEAEVFDAEVTMTGSFDRDSLSIIGDSLCIELAVPGNKVTKLKKLSLGGKEYSWIKKGDSAYSKIDLADISGDLDYAIEYKVSGSREILVTDLGESSVVTIEGAASNPSFFGSLLPNERTVTDKQFKATWEFENQRIKGGASKNDECRVSFLVGVDRYQKVIRSLKYAFIIILLTFATVLFTEIILHHPIPLFNYFLIGAALIIFYTLLLSFVEHVSFGYAYLIAAGMTVLLITVYMWKMLGSKKVGATMCAILSGIYAACYVMLCISDFALLLGSFILFFALAAMMYGSLKLKY